MIWTKAVLLGASAFLVTSAASGAVPHQQGAGKNRALQDDGSGEEPTVGLKFLDKTATSASTDSARVSPSVHEHLFGSLQSDGRVTVVGGIQLAELECDTLAGAEDASTLQFEISPTETITADRASYRVTSGDSFTDGVARKVWAGMEAGGEGGLYPREVSMTWGDACDVENFLFRMTTTNEDGSISVLKTIPCESGTSTEVCVLEVRVVLSEDGDEGVEPGTDGGNRRLRTTHTHRAAGFLRDVDADASKDRRLASMTKIDVMFLYTPGARSIIGGLTDSQFQSRLADAITDSNISMQNSKIDLELNLRHVEELPYEENRTNFTHILSTLKNSNTVKDLRDTYGADLVQLLVADGSTGIGHTYKDGFWFLGPDSDAAFSVVRATELDGHTHTHEFGHNLGCHHDIDNTNRTTDYAYGWRECDGAVKFRTIMSYHCPGTTSIARIRYFSNPDVKYAGVDTGIEPEYESSFVFFDKLKTAGANNAEVIRQNMGEVSNFRSETSATPPPTAAPTSPPTAAPVAPPVAPPVAAPVAPPVAPPVAAAPVSPPVAPPVAPVLPSGCKPDWVGNGYCDEVNNSATCMWDGGDCCACTCQVGPGACTHLICEDPYGKAGCSSGSPPVTPAVTPTPEPVAPSPPTTVSSCQSDWIGNGYCDEPNNNAGCSWDGGDCCACTCQVGPGACTYLICEDPYGQAGCV